MGQVAFTQRLICDSLGVSKGSFHRDLGVLKDEGMITVEAGRDFSVATICNWQTYQDPDDGERGAGGAQLGQDAGANRPLPKKETIQELPPPTPSAAAPANEDPWGEVEEMLGELRVSRAAEAVARAQERGLTTRDVVALMGDYAKHAGAWGPGALFGRLTGALADWPPVDPSYERQQQRQATVRNHESVVAERKAGEQRRAADELRRAELEARWGAAIDALTSDQIVAALSDDSPLVDMYHRKKLCPTVRERLAELFECQEAVA